jgi:hypothetical protein
VRHCVAGGRLGRWIDDELDCSSEMDALEGRLE